MNLTLIEDSGHVGSFLVLRRGLRRGLVHNVGQRHNRGSRHLIAHLLCPPFFRALSETEDLKRWRERRGERERLICERKEEGFFCNLRPTSAAFTMGRVLIGHRIEKPDGSWQISERHNQLFMPGWEAQYD